MRNIPSFRTSFPFLIGLSVYALYAMPARATFVNCGDTINVSTTLSGSLDCTGFNPALTVAGSGVTLDGGGFSITTGPSANAIVVTGSNNTVQNVNVDWTGSGVNGTGVNVSGSGHLIKNVSAKNRHFGVYSHDLENSIIDGGDFGGSDYGVDFGLWSANQINSNNRITGLNAAGCTNWAIESTFTKNLTIDPPTNLTGCANGFSLHMAEPHLLTGYDLSAFQILGTVFKLWGAASTIDGVKLDWTGSGVRGTGVEVSGNGHLIKNVSAKKRHFGVYSADLENSVIEGGDFGGSDYGVDFGLWSASQINSNNRITGLNAAGCTNWAIESTYTKNLTIDPPTNLTGCANGFSLHMAEPHLLTGYDLSAFQIPGIVFKLWGAASTIQDVKVDWAGSGVTGIGVEVSGSGHLIKNVSAKKRHFAVHSGDLENSVIEGGDFTGANYGVMLEMSSGSQTSGNNRITDLNAPGCNSWAVFSTYTKNLTINQPANITGCTNGIYLHVVTPHTLSGLSIPSMPGYGLRLAGNDNLLENLIIGAPLSPQAGVRIDVSGDRNTLSNVLVQGGATGVSLNGNENALDHAVIWSSNTCLAASAGSASILSSTLNGCEFGALVSASAAVTIDSAIVWSNQQDFTGTGQWSLVYSDTKQAVALGTGNISADPMFADAAMGNFQLADGSPCIDTGNPLVTPPPGGGPRIDMGRWERLAVPAMCYLDEDGDGYGSDMTILDPYGVCAAPGEVALTGDCDNANGTIYPGASETANDGIDQDCNGFDAVTCFADIDGDGYGSTTTVLGVNGDCTDPGEAITGNDCDDSVSTIHPGAPESCADQADIDCDGVAGIDGPECNAGGAGGNGGGGAGGKETGGAGGSGGEGAIGGSGGEGAIGGGGTGIGDDATNNNIEEAGNCDCSAVGHPSRNTPWGLLIGLGTALQFARRRGRELVVRRTPN